MSIQTKFDLRSTLGSWRQTARTAELVVVLVGLAR